MYKLKQFHGHTPSGHQWDGEQPAAIELHFVYEAAPFVERRGERLVLYVPGVESAGSPAELSILVKGLSRASVEGFLSTRRGR